MEYESASQRKKELDLALAMMIAKDFQPCNIFNGTDFKKFFTLLDPRYLLPSKFTVRKKNLKKKKRRRRRKRLPK